MLFQIKHYRLPHEGVIPGARGHKKQLIPRGSKVYCIVYGTRIFWAAYQNEAQAQVVATNLEASTKPTARRHIPLDTLIQWNFGPSIPKRIVRVK